MNWQNFARVAYGYSMFNWKQFLTGINVEQFQNSFLDPARGNSCCVLCPEKNNCSCDECPGLCVRNLQEGITACCTRKFTGPKYLLSSKDLVYYQISYARFHAAICNKLGLSFTNYQKDKFLYEIGMYKRGPGAFIPVYISYYAPPWYFDVAINELLGHNIPFILIVFDCSLICRESVKNIKANKCLCYSMEELFDIRSDSTLNLKLAPEDIFESFKGKASSPTSNTYQCESGASWDDIHIKYVDGETISIWMKDSEAKSVSYFALNMVDGRSGKANAAFQILINMLERKSQYIEIKHLSSKDKQCVAQHKKTLCDRLKKYFTGIDDDPIVFDKDTSSYKLRLTIV